MEQILLDTFKHKFIKLSEKYFFLKEEYKRSSKKTQLLEKWLGDRLESNNEQIKRDSFTTEFLKRFRNVSSYVESYEKVCGEIEGELLTENNSFRERLQYCKSKAKSDFKKVQKKFVKYKEKLKKLKMISKAKIGDFLGKQEIQEFIGKLGKGQIREGLKGIEILVGLCWQIRLILQELFEFNSDIGQKPKVLLNGKLTIQQFGKSKVFIY